MDADRCIGVDELLCACFGECLLLEVEGGCSPALSVPSGDVRKARAPLGPYFAACEAIFCFMFGSGRSW